MLPSPPSPEKKKNPTKSGESLVIHEHSGESSICYVLFFFSFLRVSSFGKQITFAVWFSSAPVCFSISVFSQWVRANLMGTKRERKINTVYYFVIVSQPLAGSAGMSWRKLKVPGIEAAHNIGLGYWYVFCCFSALLSKPVHRGVSRLVGALSWQRCLMKMDGFLEKHFSLFCRGDVLCFCKGVTSVSRSVNQ